MQNAEYLEKLNTFVKYTVDSGVKPIEVLLLPIYDCYNGDKIAYKSLIRVNSVLTGTLNPSDYLNCIADEKTLEAFAYRSIKKTLSAQNALKNAGVRFKNLFVGCNASFLYSDGLYTSLKALIAENGVNGKDNGVCVEFSGSVTEIETVKLKDAFSDIRSAGFKVAVDGYGGEGFSIEKLLSVCPDYVFLDEKAAGLAVDREKRAALAPLVNFARSLGAEIIAQGVVSDDELREFRSRDCFGFIPDGRYRGVLDVGGLSATVAETIAEAGENV